MKHCLVVDDSSVIRKVARCILEDMSFRTSEAENGQDALDFCRAEMPDAVLGFKEQLTETPIETEAHDIPLTELFLF